MHFPGFLGFFAFYFRNILKTVLLQIQSIEFLVFLIINELLNWAHNSDNGAQSVNANSTHLVLKYFLTS